MKQQIFYDFNAKVMVEEIEQRLINILKNINDAESLLSSIKSDSLAIDEAKDLLKRAYLDNARQLQAPMAMIKDVIEKAESLKKECLEEEK